MLLPPKTNHKGDLARLMLILVAELLISRAFIMRTWSWLIDASARGLVMLALRGTERVS